MSDSHLPTRVVGVIPARMGASRFPGKPLEKLVGVPMLGHCYFNACEALGIQNIFVATCDNEIAEYVQSIGGKVIFTSDKHKRATTRTAEALHIIEKEIDQKVDSVVMVQGDEPLVTPLDILALSRAISKKNVKIVNLMTKIQSQQDFEDKNKVKVVVNLYLQALYFSRSPIPSPTDNSDYKKALLQTGVIAFEREELNWFNDALETPLEIAESIDMNRALEHGHQVQMLMSDNMSFGVDTPFDKKAAEAELIKRRRHT